MFNYLTLKIDIEVINELVECLEKFNACITKERKLGAGLMEVEIEFDHANLTDAFLKKNNFGTVINEGFYREGY